MWWQTVQVRFDSVEAPMTTWRSATSRSSQTSSTSDKFAELLNNNDEDNSGWQAFLDKVIQEMNTGTRSQLQAGDERITARLAELDMYMKGGVR